jgi:hypothetical protein
MRVDVFWDTMYYDPIVYNVSEEAYASIFRVENAF